MRTEQALGAAENLHLLARVPTIADDGVAIAGHRLDVDAQQGAVFEDVRRVYAKPMGVVRDVDILPQGFDERGFNFTGFQWNCDRFRSFLA
jgi:hypothetical protein